MAWQGNLDDKFIILEAIDLKDLHIWHIFFGIVGSNNNLNVLDCSRLVHNMLTNEARNVHFKVNGKV